MKKDKSLIDVLIEISDNQNLLHEFLKDILTPAEYAEVKTRWEIVKMLDKGIAQHEIAKKLKVGIATVTRGSMELKDPKGGFALVLKQMKNKKV